MSSSGACASLHFTANDTLRNLLSLSLGSSLDLNPGLGNGQNSDTDFLSGLYCAGSASACHGICPNADLTGLGVRVAFWLSSIFQAFLVAISPRDSAPSTWTSTILTASVIIPALVQKSQGSLTLYHSTLVLNFASYSTLVSLAVAPMCSVWRLPSHGRRPSLSVVRTFKLFHQEGQLDGADDDLSNLPKNRVHRQRLILSLALLMQVVFQWAWILVLFAHPEYAQRPCNKETLLVLWGHVVRTTDKSSFGVWLSWLLFHGVITLIWTLLLVANSQPAVHPVLSRSPSMTDLSGTTKPHRISTKHFLPFHIMWSTLSDPGRRRVVGGNLLAGLIAIMLVGTSEAQAAINCVRGGENSQWGFGQITAILLAISPAWSIAVALAKQRERAKAAREFTFQIEKAEQKECRESDAESEPETEFLKLPPVDGHISEDSFVSEVEETLEIRTQSRDPEFR